MLKVKLPAEIGISTLFHAGNHYRNSKPYDLRDNFPNFSDKRLFVRLLVVTEVFLNNKTKNNVQIIK